MWDNDCAARGHDRSPAQQVQGRLVMDNESISESPFAESQKPLQGPQTRWETRTVRFEIVNRPNGLEAHRSRSDEQRHRRPRYANKVEVHDVCRPPIAPDENSATDDLDYQPGDLD
jgi:hypothetical protein